MDAMITRMKEVFMSIRNRKSNRDLSNPGLSNFAYRLDNKSHGRASVSSEPKVGPESDTDSMAEYGDGDTGKHGCRFIHLFAFFCF